MIEIFKNKIKSQYELQLKVDSERSKLYKELQAYADTNRKIAPDTIVEVVDWDSKHIFGKGVVKSCRVRVGLDREFDMRHYFEKDGDRYFKDSMVICYEVFALKKDGTPSTKHFFQAPHFLNLEGDRLRGNFEVILK